MTRFAVEGTSSAPSAPERRQIAASARARRRYYETALALDPICACNAPATKVWPVRLHGVEVGLVVTCGAHRPAGPLALAEVEA